MKIHLLASLVIFAAVLAAYAGAAGAEQVDLAYELRIDRPETGTGQVTLTVSGLTGTGFALPRPRSAGESWFDGVSASSPTGKAYAVVATDEGWYVTTDGSATAAVAYTIRPGQVGGYGHIGLITADFAALDGSLVFLAPGDAQEIRSVTATFRLPAGWKPITSWRASGDSYSPDVAFAPLRRQLAGSLLCFGNFTAFSQPYGTNTLAVHVPASYPKADADELAGLLQRIYARFYDLLGFETGGRYNVVCLPPGPDGLPVVAGAWADGQALTLAGRFAPEEVLRQVKAYGRFIAMGHFVDAPYGVELSDEDRWLYAAVMTYAEEVAAVTGGKTTQNLFYSPIYTWYAAEASADHSSVDLPAAGLRTAPPEARAFIQGVKAPLLLMRMDFEIRFVTQNAANIEHFLRALYEQGRSGRSPAKALEALSSVTRADFTAFYDTFVRSRTLILPTWPAFIEELEAMRGEPGPVVAEVDGAPIYQREIDIMTEALLSEGRMGSRADAQAAALAALVNEKMLDKALASYGVNVVPEAFWRLRLALPGRVMRLLVTRKRQTLKDVLYDEWFSAARRNDKVEMRGTLQAPAPDIIFRERQ